MKVEETAAATSLPLGPRVVGQLDVFSLFPREFDDCCTRADIHLAVCGAVSGADGPVTRLPAGSACE